MYKVYVAFLIICLLVIFIVVDNNRLSVTDRTVSIRNLPDNFEGFTIIQLSDLHDKRFGKDQRRLIKKIDSINPDICLITGDYVMSHKQLPENSLQLLEKLGKHRPVFVITGNHEGHHADWKAIEKLTEQSGSIILRGKSSISRGNAHISLFGIDDPAFYGCCDNPYIGAFKEELERIAALREDDIPSVLLSHRPELLSLYAELGFDLVFSGHAHGGLWRIPLVGGIAAPDQGLFPKYTAGIYEMNGTSMMVSRGLGLAKVPVRILNPPEIVVVRLTRAVGGI